jgi:hypothetical protein
VAGGEMDEKGNMDGSVRVGNWKNEYGAGVAVVVPVVLNRLVLEGRDARLLVLFVELAERRWMGRDGAWDMDWDGELGSREQRWRRLDEERRCEDNTSSS